MKPAIDLPDDPALPGVGAIRALGLARAIPALGLDGRGIELALRGYTPGSRATIAACAGNRRFVVKAYAADPASEARVYRALAAGLEATRAPGSRPCSCAIMTSGCSSSVGSTEPRRTSC